MKSHSAFLAALLSIAVSPAFAAGGAGADQPTLPASELQLGVTIYAGGITLGKADIDATIRGSDYHAVSHLTTSGVVNTFWQAEIQATSSGKIGVKSIQPALYDSFDTNHAGRKQEVSLTYDGAGATPRLYADPAYSMTGYEVSADAQRATADPLSALMLIMSGMGADAADPCAVTAPVFDGRRRYNIEITKVRSTDIKLDNGLYAGPALLCQLKYHQIAGFKPRVLKSGENFPTVNAWIGVFPSAVTGHSYAVPLRIWAQTQYGLVAVVANALKIDGMAPKGAS